LTKVEENGMAYTAADSSTMPAEEHSNGVEESSMVVDREAKEDEEIEENAPLAKFDAPSVNFEAAETSSTSPTISSTVQPNVHPQSETPYKTKRKNGQPFEEPFKYLDPDMEELEIIRKFYNISPRFPRDRFMVRNATGTATKNIYYTTELAKSILQENEGKGMKFVHSGVKMFVKQDVPSPEICPWRIQTDGLAILEAWVGPERIVKLTKRQTLRKLLIEMFPRFHGDDWKNLGEIGEQVRDIGMGCCVLRVEPTDEEDGLRYVYSIITSRPG
jgi:multisite-specific tRNA:(cytosine-C5)-methyltransferase